MPNLVNRLPDILKKLSTLRENMKYSRSCRISPESQAFVETFPHF